MSANRGKYAEGKVREFLEMWKQTYVGFTYNRILDAHSAKGAMSAPQPGDFQWFLDTGYTCDYSRPAQPGESMIAESMARLGRHLDKVTVLETKPYTRNGLIEVKEVAHAFRLPHKNFSPDQVGRLNIRRLAGSEPCVLVCHKMEGRGKSYWRSVPLAFFETRTGGSWDLSEFFTATTPGDFLEPYLT